MTEKQRIIEANQQFLASTTHHDLPGGDRIYTDLASSTDVMVVGRGYLDYLPELLGLINFSETRTRRLSGRGTKSKTAWVFQEQLQDGTKVAVKVKRNKGWVEGAVPMWMNGVDACKAIRTLEEKGVESIDILLATENVIITKWSDDREINFNDPDEAAEWKAFETRLRRLDTTLPSVRSRSRTNWQMNWRVDHYPQNYRRREGKFVAIDPVWLGVV